MELSAFELLSALYILVLAAFVGYEVVSKVPLKTRADLAMAYTPGVARVSRTIVSPVVSDVAH